MFYRHNPQITLMRTTVEENILQARRIAGRLNQCEGEVRFLLPTGGVSALDAPGQPFWDQRADAALFETLTAELEQTDRRKLRRVPYHIKRSSVRPGRGRRIPGSGAANLALRE
jgi:uncharacterized protein (UPF0261 family)